MKSLERLDNKLLCLGTSRLDSPTSHLGKLMKLSGGMLYKHAKPIQKIYLAVVHCENDLNHVCRAFNEHTGVYVRCQAHQLRLLPQEHVTGTYVVCALYMYLYS